MKLTTKQLLVVVNTAVVNGAGSLARFFATAKPPAVAWTARKAPKMVDEALKEYREAERAIFERHGDPVKDDSGQVVSIQVRPDELAAHNAELAELHAQTIELPGEAITVAQLIKPELSEVDMAALEEAGFLKE
jgi:hypothetical protein